MKINLGCGEDYRPGWVNADCQAVRKDVHADLRAERWPFLDSCADVVLMQGVLEHLPDTVHTMEEVWRILKPGGHFIGSVPFACSTFAFRDPTHVRYFDEKAFEYFTRPIPWTSSRARFTIDHVTLGSYKDTLGHKVRNLIPGRCVLKWFLWGMYDFIDFDLRAEK